MIRRMSGWTDLAVTAAAGIVVAVGLAYAAAAANALHPALVLGAAGLVTVLATRTDAFGGAVVGLFASAGVAGAQLLLFGVPDGGALPWVIVFALLLVLGALGGAVGDRMRRDRRRAERARETAIVPADGSLGLLREEDARLRLAEEITRARLFDRPLSAATVTVEVPDEALSRAEARRAVRAVARALESELRPTDVPFVLDGGGFGAVLPESAPEAAADVVGSVLIAAAESTFADRTAGGRRRVGDVIRLHLGVVDASRADADVPEAVLHTASRELRHFDPVAEAVPR